MAQLNNIEPRQTVFLGSFKPPTVDDFNAANSISSDNNVINLTILISDKEKDGITAKMSKEIWDLYYKSITNSKVIVKISSEASPVKYLFSLMNEYNDLKLYIYVSEVDEESKGYFDNLQKAFGDRIKAISSQYKTSIKDEDFRNLLINLKTEVDKLQEGKYSDEEYDKIRNDYFNILENIKKMIPESVISKGNIQKVLEILNIQYIEQKEDFKTKNINIGINEIYDLALKNSLNEMFPNIKIEESDPRKEKLNKFNNWCCKVLEVKKQPEVRYIEDNNYAKNLKSFGGYSPEKKDIEVYILNRNLADIMRTLAHELVHYKQDECGLIKDKNAGDAGSDIENEANSTAAIIMRHYGKLNDDIYE